MFENDIFSVKLSEFIRNYLERDSNFYLAALGMIGLLVNYIGRGSWSPPYNRSYPSHNHVLNLGFF